jgi:hypothetical protein
MKKAGLDLENKGSRALATSDLPDRFRHEEKMKIRSFLTCCGGLILFSSFSLSILPARDSLSDECKILIAQADVLLSKMKGWDHQSIMVYFLTIAIGVLGFAIWILQKVKRPWIRGATSALGLIIVVLTVINTTSIDADYRMAKRNTMQLRAEIMDAKDKLRGFDDACEADKQIYRETVIELIKKVDVAEEQLLNTQLSFESFSTTYAFSDPRWISDRVNDYFQGRGENSSLAIAKDLSYSNAIDNAVRQLGSRDAARSTIDSNDPFRKYIVSSSAVAQSGFSYDAGRGIYKYSVLLKISRTLTQPRLIKAVVRS